MPVVCLDLDGVLWRGDDAVPGAAGGVAALRASGLRVAFLSNNSSMPVGDVVAKLDRFGVRARARRGAHQRGRGGGAPRRSPRAGQPRARVRRPGRVRSARRVRARCRCTRCRPTRSSSASTASSTTTSSTVRHAWCVPVPCFVATNMDADVSRPARTSSPGPARSSPRSRPPSGAAPLVAGKPEAADGRRSSTNGSAHSGVMVGDRPSTDGALAAALGWPFGLVLSGVTAAVAPPGGEAIPDPRPATSPRTSARSPDARRRPHLRLPGATSSPGEPRRRPAIAAADAVVPRTPETRRAAYPRWMTQRRRLDAELVRRGLLGQPPTSGRGDQRRAGCSSPARRRTTPARLVEARPSRSSSAGDAPAVRVAWRREAGRGARPLRASTWRRRRAVDLGASTGGFTDCLLQAGAASVVAVDVGRGQLAWSLRTDPRVTLLERTNVRATSTPTAVGGAARPARRRPLVHLAASPSPRRIVRVHPPTTPTSCSW